MSSSRSPARSSRSPARASSTREKLPDDFGLAESNARFGHVDAIVPRAELRPFVGRLLAMFSQAQ